GGRGAAENEAEGVAAWSAPDEVAGFLDGSFEVGDAVADDTHRARTVDDEGDILPRRRGEAGEVEVFFKGDQGDTGEEQSDRDRGDATPPFRLLVQDHG